MNKKDVKYYAVIAVILVITIVFEIMKPKPIDWRFTLESGEKEPYGTYVLFKTMNNIFPEQEIKINKRTAYEHDKQQIIKQKNYIYIADRFNTDELDTETILNFAEKGSSVFISAHYFGSFFTDTLDFSVNNTAFFDTTSNLNFYNHKLKREKPYFFGKTAGNYFFDDFDRTKAQVLAFSKEDRPTFIRQPFGKGEFLISTTPEIFTNYAMVTEKNFECAYNSLSYLPVKETVWDEYYKPFRRQSKTELSVIFENPSFKMAYILIILSALVFAFFNIKRRQRIIPIIKPFQNKTLEFVETISRVYFHSKNHKDIALKKYLYFKSFLYSKYSINLSENENIDYNNIAEKTGADIQTIKKLLLAYLKINKLEKISGEELNTFNNYIEEFYEDSK